MKKNLERIVPAVFSGYIFLSLLVLSLLGKFLPVVITNILSISYFIFIPLGPILRPLGMWEGEIWSGPTIPGLILGVIIYDLILFVIFKVLASLIRRGH